MKRIVKRISVFVVCLAVIFTGSGLSVSATGNPQKIVYGEITDIYELIELGLLQRAAQPSLCAYHDTEQTTLHVEQLLSRIVYADGTVEETYVHSGITVTDENGIALPTSLIDSAMNKTGSGSYNGVIVNINMYYTVRTNTSNMSVLFRFDKMVTTIHNENNSSTPPIRGENRYYHEKEGIYVSQPFYLDQTTKIQSATLMSSHSQFVVSEDAYYGWKAIAYVYLSNGVEIAVQVTASTAG